MSCKSILVVEDDDDIRLQLVKALKVEGYATYFASNGKEALELLKTLPTDELPDCMILDLMMPIMDGATLMEILNRDYKNEFGGIKIIVATAKGSPANTKAIAQSVQRIQKPFDLDQLYRVIEEACGKPS